MIVSLKRMTILVVLLVVLGGATTWGLGRVTSPKVFGQVLRAEASEGPLRLVLIVDKTIYGIGEKINLTVQIVNINNSTVELLYGTPFVMPPIRFNISDSQDRMVYNSPTYTSTMDVRSKNVTLEPNHSFGLIMNWRQWNNTLEQVAPGEYYITVEIIPNALFVFEYVNGTKVTMGTTYVKTPSLTIIIST